ILANDSIYTLSKYKVAINQGLSGADIQAGNMFTIYNANGTNKDYCDAWIPEMYLISSASSYVVTGNVFSKCNVNQTSPLTYRRLSGPNLGFSEEWRPAYYVDSVVITIPDGYESLGASFRDNGGAPASQTAIFAPSGILTP